MEMFIVSSGAVQVVGGPGDSIVFVTLGQVRSKIFTLFQYKIFNLGQGVCFGEIALLGTGGMNRRTASIKVRHEKISDTCDILSAQAHGFTTLFVLFKWDLQDRGEYSARN